MQWWCSPRSALNNMAYAMIKIKYLKDMTGKCNRQQIDTIGWEKLSEHQCKWNFFQERTFVCI